MATWKQKVRAPAALKQGYAFEYVGRNWKSSPDDEWDQTIVEGGGATFVGFRTLDGRQHAVFKAPSGEYLAQMAHYVRNPRMKSMTYGIVPPYAEFERHVSTWKNEEGEGIDVGESPVYKMELVGLDDECGRESAKDIPGVHVTDTGRKTRIEIDDVAALWAFVNSLMHHGDDADEYVEKYNISTEEPLGDGFRDLASSVMYTLGYEWI